MRPDPGARDHGWADRWPWRTHLELAPLPTAPPCARLHAREVLWEWKLDTIADDCEVVISELLANSIAATISTERTGPILSPSIHLWLLGGKGRVLLLVWDASTAPPARRNPTAEDEHGRGLLLVEAISVRWGWYLPPPPNAGKVIWSLLKTAR